MVADDIFLLATTGAIKAGDFTYTTNSPDTNTITITGYTGPGGAVDIPTNILGKTVTSIGDYAFSDCGSLTGVYFRGNTPSIGAGLFEYADSVTVYYFPGNTGWGTTFAGRPTALLKDDPATHLWFVYSLATKKAIVWKLNWGFVGGIPVSGDYDGDGKTDFAMYDKAYGKWYIRNLAGKVLVWNQTLGGGAAVPVKP